MKLFKYQSYKSAFPDIASAKRHMLELHDALENTHLHNLRAFNFTYYIITKNVSDKFGSGYFSDEATMTALDLDFAQFYFDALKGFVDENPIPPAWRILFEACQDNSHYQFMYMALGVNAHVNNDLMQSLHQSATPYFLEGYFKVNDIVSKSLPEVVENLHEESRLLSISENVLEQAYAYFLKELIKNWRQYAWQQFINLNGGKITVAVIEQHAHKLALELRDIEHIRELPKLYKVWE